MNNKISVIKIFPEIKYSLKLAIPLIVTEIIYGSSGFISTIFIAKLGKEELAANVLVWPIFVAILLLVIGILSSVTVLVAQSYGANDKAGIQTASRQGIWVAILAAIPLMLAITAAPKILLITGQDPAIIKLATPYFHSLAWSILPISLFIVLEQFLLGITKTRLVMAMSILIVPIQIAAIYFLMLGKYHFGLPSIGYGFAIAHTITTIMIGLYIHFAKSCRDYRIFSNFWQFNKKFFFEIIKLGLPIGSMYCIELCLFSANALMMGKFGADALAGHQIAMQCTAFTIGVIFALGQTIGIRVGYEVGQNNRPALRLAFFTNIGIGFFFMFLLAIVYILFPKNIIALDVDIHLLKYQALITYAVKFMLVAAIAQFADCCRIHCVCGLRSLKDTKFPMWTSMIGFWLISFPLAYVLAFICHVGPVGIWSGTAIGLGCCALALFIRFNRLSKKIALAEMVTK